MVESILKEFHNGHACCRQLVTIIEKINPYYVLDIGCGDGRDLNFLIEHNLIGMGVGVDDHHTPEVYDKFQERVGLKFINMEVTKYLSEYAVRGFYNCIISNNSFEHFSNPEEILYLCSQVLSLDGFIFITLPYRTNHWDPDHKFAYEEESLTKMVDKFFKVIECWQIGGGNMYIFAQKVIK
jgi:cyclopropane fatty-acyl-phospholipid synthase-like methyltransferase